MPLQEGFHPSFDVTGKDIICTMFADLQDRAQALLELAWEVWQADDPQVAPL